MKKIEHHHNYQRPHQGIENCIPMGYKYPASPGELQHVKCEESLGGMLKHYYLKNAAWHQFAINELWFFPKFQSTAVAIPSNGFFAVYFTVFKEKNVFYSSGYWFSSFVRLSFYTFAILIGLFSQCVNGFEFLHLTAQVNIESCALCPGGVFRHKHLTPVCTFQQQLRNLSFTHSKSLFSFNRFYFMYKLSCMI